MHKKGKVYICYASAYLTPVSRACVYRANKNKVHTLTNSECQGKDSTKVLIGIY